MWQEARKQEKKIRGIMIDYKKRAERRQAYYTKMKMDPHQLIRIYGQKCKLNIMGESCTVMNNGDGQLMPWQGDAEVLIDRFDVRAHLDYIPEDTAKSEEEEEKDAEEEKFSRKCCYERYRTLVQVDATGAEEEQYIKQLQIEEEYGKKQAERINLEKERRKGRSKASAKIHYQYEGSSVVSENDDDSNDSESDGELSDIDISVNVLELTPEQKSHLDALATQYGVGYGQYCRQLLLEKKEFEFVKRLEEEEDERSKMPGRKGKSARRSLRAKQKTLRGSPLSFAMKEEIDDNDKDDDSSTDSSRSTSPFRGEEKIEFITEFGGDTTSDKLKTNKETSSTKKANRPKDTYTHRSKRSSRSRSRSKHRTSRSRHRSRSHSRDRSSKYGRDKHVSRRSRSRSRSRSQSSRSRSRSQRDRSSSSKTHRRRSTRSRSRSTSTKKYDRKDSTDRHRSRNKSESDGPSNSSEHNKMLTSRSPESSCRKRSKSPKHPAIKKLTETSKPASPAVDKSKLTPREKMKLRMQKMLNKQIKTDKKVEQKKLVAKEQEIEERDQEIYEMSRMMRNKEREKKRRSVSPKGRLPSYDASQFRYKPTKDDDESP